MDEESLTVLLEETWRLHLISDAPLAVFLSSGVDSWSVANLAQRAARTPVHTSTLALEDEELNEGQPARRIAAAIGTQHQEVLLTEEKLVEGLNAALNTFDQPHTRRTQLVLHLARHAENRIQGGSTFPPRSARAGSGRASRRAPIYHRAALLGR
jgi:asparagine synthetase B (glutamine-hydrolysing)